MQIDLKQLENSIIEAYQNGVQNNVDQILNNPNYFQYIKMLFENSDSNHVLFFCTSYFKNYVLYGMDVLQVENNNNFIDFLFSTSVNRIFIIINYEPTLNNLSYVFSKLLDKFYRVINMADVVMNTIISKDTQDSNLLCFFSSILVEFCKLIKDSNVNYDKNELYSLIFVFSYFMSYKYIDNHENGLSLLIISKLLKASKICVKNCRRETNNKFDFPVVWYEQITNIDLINTINQFFLNINDYKIKRKVLFIMYSFYFNNTDNKDFITNSLIFLNGIYQFLSSSDLILNPPLFFDILKFIKRFFKVYDRLYIENRQMYFSFFINFIENYLEYYLSPEFVHDVSGNVSLELVETLFEIDELCKKRFSVYVDKISNIKQNAFNLNIDCIIKGLTNSGTMETFYNLYIGNDREIDSLRIFYKLVSYDSTYECINKIVQLIKNKLDDLSNERNSEICISFLIIHGLLITKHAADLNIMREGSERDNMIYNIFAAFYLIIIDCFECFLSTPHKEGRFAIENALIYFLNVFRENRLFKNEYTVGEMFIEVFKQKFQNNIIVGDFFFKFIFDNINNILLDPTRVEMMDEILISIKEISRKSQSTIISNDFTRRAFFELSSIREKLISLLTSYQYGRNRSLFHSILASLSVPEYFNITKFLNTTYGFVFTDGSQDDMIIHGLLRDFIGYFNKKYTYSDNLTLYLDFIFPERLNIVFKHVYCSRNPILFKCLLKLYYVILKAFDENLVLTKPHSPNIIYLFKQAAELIASVMDLNIINITQKSDDVMRIICLILRLFYYLFSSKKIPHNVFELFKDPVFRNLIQNFFIFIDRTNNFTENIQKSEAYIYSISECLARKHCRIILTAETDQLTLLFKIIQKGLNSYSLVYNKFAANSISYIIKYTNNVVISDDFLICYQGVLKLAFQNRHDCFLECIKLIIKFSKECFDLLINKISKFLVHGTNETFNILVNEFTSLLPDEFDKPDFISTLKKFINDVKKLVISPQIVFE